MDPRAIKVKKEEKKKEVNMIIFSKKTSNKRSGGVKFEDLFGATYGVLMSYGKGVLEKKEIRKKKWKRTKKERTTYKYICETKSSEWKSTIKFFQERFTL